MPRWNSFNNFLEEAAQADSDTARQALVDVLLAEKQHWPWVEDGQATFIYTGNNLSNVALNLDTIPSDPPFDPMVNLFGTNLWYVSRAFAPDDLLDYMLAVNDPMTPLAQERDIAARVSGFWWADPRNPLHMDTPQMNVSVLRMNEARPFPDWSSFRAVLHGRVTEHIVNSAEIGFSGRKLWVYTPPGYDSSAGAYPLLVLHDGQWAVGPLQVTYIADALIKYQRLQPTVIAMIQSGTQDERNREYVASDKHYAYLLTELLPFVQTNYRIDSTSIAVGGVAVGAVAAAHAALRNPAVFSGLMMISPPLGKGQFQEQLQELISRFENSESLPKRIFQSVGRYEARGRFYRPAIALSDVLETRSSTAYKFVETGSGHGLVGFKSVMPEALAWMFPGGAFG
jgi:enterochelin esterase-like enzyme